MELSARRRPPRPSRPRRRGTALLVGVLLVGVGLGVGLAGPGSPEAVPSAAGNAAAQAAARSFLSRYEAPDGRVVRADQGGDTVSEGQAYAMLLAVAAGDRGRFAASWSWATAHLRQPDGLWAWRWSAGRVADIQSAADADVDAAWALELAAARFGRAGYAQAGTALAAAVLANETAMTARGAVLVAGPWARASLTVDPSYLAPEAAAVLESTPAGGGWKPLAGDDQGVLESLVRPPDPQAAGAPATDPPSPGADAPTPPPRASLPPDWVQVGAGGALGPRAGPTDPAGAARYGLDAERIPIVLAASCQPADRALAASIWPVLSRVAGQGADAGYYLDGAVQDTAPSPVGLVAVAAAAGAAGRARTARVLLGRAAAMVGAHPSYYGDAWVALGEVLLTTKLLGTCPVA